jgi:hypothetical protein
VKLSCCGSLPSPGHTTLRIQAANDSLIDYRDLDSDGDGISDVSIETKLKNLGLLEPTAAHRLIIDSDDDGLPEQEISSSIVPTKSQMAINTKGTGAQNGRVVAIKSETSVDSAMQVVHIDDDGDGNPESGSLTLITADSSGNWLDNDSDDDGVSDVVNSRVVLRSGTKSKLVWSPQSNLIVNEAEMTVDSSSSTVSNRMDVDGDGIPESEASTIVAPTTSSLAIKTKGTGANRFRGGGDCDDADVRWYVDNDDDGDDIPDHEASMTVTPTKSSVAIKTKGTGADKDRSAITGETNDSMAVTINSMDPDDDGLVDNEVSTIVTPTTSSVAINTKGTGADKNRIVGTTDDSSAVVTLDSDSASIAMKVKNGGKITGAITVNNGNGSKIDLGLGEDSTVMSQSLDLDGDDLIDVAILGACTPDSVVKEITYEFTNSLLAPALMKAKEKANKTKCSNGLRQQSPISVTETEVSCDSADARMSWTANDFGGSISSIIIQASVSGALNPIEHSSGAHLSPGGTWTNASDENLKENFQTIDGDDLLEKIDELNIGEWNYINESESVKHIGPTAQDFEKTFGLGSDGKSISTIDPAGIALAAIKALNAKSKKVDELEAKVAELSKLVERLLSDKQ